MKKIVLLCALGVSTGMLVEKMRKAAAEIEFDCTVEAHSIDEFDEATVGADIILLGPQVSYALDDLVSEHPDKKIEAIDMLAYGTMDGKKVISHCKEVLGD